MRFKVGHPSLPAYDFYLLSHTPDVEAAVNELGPVAVAASTYDWPEYYDFHGWTDTINSLWWPQGAARFATCVLLIDDARNDLLTSCVLAQKAAAGDSAVPPHLVLRTMLAPAEEDRPAESFPFAGVDPVTVETELVAWKLYPLSPINITSLSADERFRGLWLLPLVDARYFYRNAALPDPSGSSSSSSTACDCGYPKVCEGTADFPAWMPDVLTFPRDLSAPLYYEPITGQGVQPTVTGATPLGPAADLQAAMLGLRVVCRDVRSNYNSTTVADSHTAFTGVVCDYPEDFSGPDPAGYHQSALAMLGSAGLRKAGGLCNVATLDQFVAKKIQFIFEVESSTCFYSVTVQRDADSPTSVADFSVTENGPSGDERLTVPAVLMGMKVVDRDPTEDETAAMVAAAKQWCLLYNWWRTDQAYLRYPAIVPVIPNGHAQMIRWDFQSDYCYTTYVALEGVEGTSPDSRLYAAKRLPFYARIDGEGDVARGLHGVYAYSELADANGRLTVRAGGRKGYVAGVNGKYTTVNPAKDEANKVAVPVGLTVWLKPGKVYADITTGMCFDHYLFTTTDLLQVVRKKFPEETNALGQFRVTIKRYDHETNELVASKEAWGILLQ